MPHPQKKFATLRQWNRRKNYYLKSVRMKLAKLFWDAPVRRPFETASVKKVLLLRDDGKIGDMVVSTCLFREFHRRGYTVDVLATSENATIIDNNPYIHKLFINDNDNIAQVLSRENYDAIIDMGEKISPRSLKFLKKITAKHVIGFNKEKYNIYNKSISFNGYNKHIKARYSSLMENLGFENYSTAYELFIPEEINAQTVEFLHTLPGNCHIVINPFAADSKRDFSVIQLQELINEINDNYSYVNILIIGFPKRLQQLALKGAIIYKSTSIYNAMSLIFHANLVISPDTSIVHICATWRKPLVSLYGNDKHGDFVNNDVWGPGYPEAVQLTTRDKNHTVSTIPTSIIMQEINNMLAKEE